MQKLKRTLLALKTGILADYKNAKVELKSYSLFKALMANYSGLKLSGKGSSLLHRVIS